MCVQGCHPSTLYDAAVNTFTITKIQGWHPFPKTADSAGDGIPFFPDELRNRQ